ncbi:hypothetical protein ACQKJG_18240 [Priestia megaterium]|uniref:hypothetical protein n=1 Tax=Priestia megaterium TaxID=1404 RepID=UPI003CFD66C6
MDSIDLNDIDYSKYDVEIVPQEDDRFDDVLKQLTSILQDRSIPEEHKQLTRAHFNMLMERKMIMAKPPTIILTPKK